MAASILIVPSSRVGARVVVRDDMAWSVTSTASPVLAMGSEDRAGFRTCASKRSGEQGTWAIRKVEP